MPARLAGRQFHNQPAASHTHSFLVDLWDEVRVATAGALAVTVHAQNGGIAGSDPGALEMLISGELEFMALMGGILGKVAPSAEIQGLPFAFSSHAEVHAAMRGALGDHLRREMAAKGIHGFRHGVLENGFRHIVSIDRPVRSAADLAGYRMRIPDGRMFEDAFRSLGAQPVVVNIRELYSALRDHQVHGQENPLAVLEVNRLYEVSRYVSLTGHMWSGFNLIGNLAFWRRLPEDVQEIVNRAVAKHSERQRAYTEVFNHDLETKLVRERGMVLNTADAASFRAVLSGEFYQRWRRELGETAWRLLDDAVGRLQ
ncbi:MAG: TRAP transporter substrate-binding protein [Betaproteobacteria bacterium]|nr:TRAP transporter substrate-binding protein [Betaproteobacteria bacterium]